jgi:HEPN domain-containing protein
LSTSDPEARELASEWLTYARADLVAAELLLAHEDETVPRIVCFHAQQSAEKALKALLVAEQIRFERTHDLVAVFELIPSSLRMDVDTETLSALSTWAVDPRYPGDLPEATLADAREAVRAARSIVDAAAETLGT